MSLACCPDCSVVIAGGMGVRAQDLFSQKGIKVVVGADPAAGSPEDIVRLYLAGSLKSFPVI